MKEKKERKTFAGMWIQTSKLRFAKQPNQDPIISEQFQTNHDAEQIRCERDRTSAIE